MLPYMILTLLFSPAWAQSPSPPGNREIVITRQTVQEVSSNILDDLKTAQSDIVNAYVPNVSYLTPFLTYQTLSPDSLAHLVETCYTQQGFLLNNPSLIDALLPTLPQDFFVANFDTEGLFAKTNEQVLQTIQQASQGHTCTVMSRTEVSYQITLGDCARQLPALCISPVTELPSTQRSTELAAQLKQDLLPILGLTIESLTYFSKQLVIAQPWINTIGVKLTDLGQQTAELKADILGKVPSMSLFFKVMLINQYVQQLLHVNLISQAQVLTTTQEQSIQQDIDGFRQRLQALDANTTRQQEHFLDQHRDTQAEAQALLEQQRAQAHSILQQLEKATKQLNFTQNSVSEDTSPQPPDNDYEEYDDSPESGSSPDDQFVDHWPFQVLYDEIKTMQISIDLCKSNQTTCCLYNQTNPTVSLWPTDLVLTFRDVMEYSIYNFYAAVSWSLVMFSILLISCCFTKKQSQQILQLQQEVKALRKCQCPHAAAEASSSSREPLLNKRKIISALNYAASSTT